LDLLPALYESIMIPPAVQREFGVILPWLEVAPPTSSGIVIALKMLVDEGEAEAIALARESSNLLILDDRDARRVARQIGVSFMGTVGMLIKAKQAGVISSLKPLLDALEVNEFYLSEGLKLEALRLAGEIS
ncbi:MAG: DUF3368 domain-containing protein, partial [Okeania sp. SIO2H7]|nr:DUF3368 domain-containing protein [Okeania sp. SIO2H7]